MTDRLSPLDVSFLYLETPTTAMHVGGVAVFEPPESGFDYDRLVELISERIALVPRYRQKVRFIPGRLANPVWVDDEDEFAQHRIEHAYPEDVCALAIATAERIHTAVTDRVAPFDGSAHAWFDERWSGAVDRT